MELYGPQSGQKQADWDQETGAKESVPRWNVWKREVYPERPGFPDCAFYMRTGSCGYGAKCRYNHPPNRIILLGGAEYPERIGEPACQYYLTTGKCKFGAFCKYNHPKNAAGSLTMNHRGYPLRPGEKECSYYLEMGKCKFGVVCKFHHPHPAGTTTTTTMPASARPFYQTMQSVSPSPELYDGSIISYRVARPPMLPGYYVPGVYGPLLLHPGTVPVPNWNSYSGPVSAAQLPSGQMSVGATAYVYGMTQIGSSPAPAFTGSYSHQVLSSDSPSGKTAKEHQFPERPDQPDCKYYMKTGDCKYAQSCGYNHPPNVALSIPASALSPLGLPLRPGVQACAFYMQNGHCKFGRMCKFDHPMANSNYVPASSYTEMPG